MLSLRQSRSVPLALACVAAACSPARINPAPTTAPTRAPTTAAPTAPTPAPAGPRVIIPPPVVSSLRDHPVVPLPTSVTPSDGAPFTLDSTTTVVYAGGAEAMRVADHLARLLRPGARQSFPLSEASGAAARGAIVLRLDAASGHGEEGYELTVSADSVRLVASRAAGLFHGVQTLRQLLPAGIEAEQGDMRMAPAWTAPAGRIVDRPRYAWRGAMLDVARHFFTVDEVKQYVDMLALYKLNVLHLHLSDDQGWRIQIDSRPRLTSIGGSSEVGGGPGGFYTKADYAEIVRYAAERFITIVPEIDMPGHTHAAIAAYPEVGCSRPMPGRSPNAPLPEVYTGIVVGWSTFCPEKEETYRLVEDIVRELAAMTPGPYLHIGGDEVAALTDSQYTLFIERVQDIVYKHGKTMIGWEEVAQARLRPTSIAQFWQKDSTAMRAARQGAKLVFSPGPKAYVDMKYTGASELGLRWAGFIELRTAYDWDPAAYLPGVDPRSILGVEAPLWSETIQNITAAMFLAVPRVPALAEVGWSEQSAREWSGFRRRIAWHAPRWRMLGINYYPSPQVDWTVGAPVVPPAPVAPVLVP